MGQLITSNVATSLYWLGRYIERIEATLYQVITAYDDIIDVDKDAGVKLYNSFGIELKYTNALEFLNVALTGEHSSNMITLSGFARENAIISRNHLNNPSFGEIIALNALFQNTTKNHVQIDYKLIDNAQSLISEIWGEFAKREHKQNNDYFVKLGKLVEEADFYFRFHLEDEYSEIIVGEIHAILNILSGEDNLTSSQTQKQSGAALDTMSEIYKKIESIIIE
jgi:uncharacterized alpha-E superfamily protein